jgi:hypothetical protein
VALQVGVELAIRAAAPGFIEFGVNELEVIQ